MRQSILLVLASMATLAVTACSESLPYEPKPRCNITGATARVDSTWTDSTGMVHQDIVAHLCGMPAQPKG